MSRTASVSFRERNLWAYDVSLSILLAELINVISDLDLAKRPRWLSELLPDRRRHAVLGANAHRDLDLCLSEPNRDVTFEQVAAVVPGGLPPSAYRHRGGGPTTRKASTFMPGPGSTPGGGCGCRSRWRVVTFVRNSSRLARAADCGRPRLS
jgi:hypothetical protein